MNEVKSVNTSDDGKIQVELKSKSTGFHWQTIVYVALGYVAMQVGQHFGIDLQPILNLLIPNAPAI